MLCCLLNRKSTAVYWNHPHPFNTKDAKDTKYTTLIRGEKNIYSCIFLTNMSSITTTRDFEKWKVVEFLYKLHFITVTKELKVMVCIWECRGTDLANLKTIYLNIILLHLLGLRCASDHWAIQISYTLLNENNMFLLQNLLVFLPRSLNLEADFEKSWMYWDEMVAFLYLFFIISANFTRINEVKMEFNNRRFNPKYFSSWILIKKIVKLVSFIKLTSFTTIYLWSANLAMFYLVP